MKNYRKIEVSMAVFLMSTVIIFSQDWPQFRGPGRDGKVTGFKAPASWPAALTQDWKITVGTGDATPVLTGNKMYLHTRQGGDEVILCIDASSGKELWRNSYPVTAATGPAASHPGPRSTPAVSNGKVVTFGISGILSCLDASTGKVIWRKENPSNEIPQFYTGMSPLIVDGICFAHVGTKDKGQFIAVDLGSGKEKWIWNGDGPSYASPSLMTIAGQKHIIVQTEKNLLALNFTDGKVLWQVPAVPSQRFYNCSSPYIDGNKIYFTGQGTGIKGIEVVRQGDQFITKELWSNTEVGAKWNTPVLVKGYLFGFSDQKRAFCVSASDGRTGWIDNTVNSDFSTINDCGNILTGLTSTGNMLVFNPDPKAYTEIAKYKVSETAIYAFPVIAGNAVYIKDAESLTKYIIK